ncbi:MAG: hypothetical protein HYT11_03220 [Candidatus Levybacteria bacterium]|nr:hypothetical protein [Candidatus Levybacteria bacterium]
MKISNFKFQIRDIALPSIIVVIAVLMRLLPHLPNFTPIAAMALFGGCYLDKKYAIAIPLLAMFVSDIFLGFHNTMIFVYGSFLLTGFLGMWLRRKKSVSSVAGAAILSSIGFFIITNFGVWAVTELYPKTLNGLIESYYFALPFFRNTVIGDLLYTGVFFGGYEAIKDIRILRYKDIKREVS